MLSLIIQSILVACVVIFISWLHNLGVIGVIDEIAKDSNSKNTIKKVKKESSFLMRLTRLCMWNMKTTRSATMRFCILLSCFMWFVLNPFLIFIWVAAQWMEEYSSFFTAVFKDIIFYSWTFYVVVWVTLKKNGEYLEKHRDKYFKSRKRKK